MSKELEDYEFSELVDEMTRNTHSRLLETGGSGLRNGIWTAMQTAIQWRDKRDAKEKAAKKKTK